MNGADVIGRPDFVFSERRLVVFVDGCFWHGCPKCKDIPASNTSYWNRKIEGNKKRDKALAIQLQRDGWKVLRFWEHQLRDLEVVMRRIKRALDATE